jgi:hypothetical protein
MLPALLVKFLFLVQHFGNKLNGGLIQSPFGKGDQ